MDTWFVRYRRAVLIAAHLVLVALASQLAFLLRFEGDIPSTTFVKELRLLPWLLLTRGLFFAFFGVYSGSMRYAGLWDLRNIIASVGAGSLLFSSVVWFLYGRTVYPISVFVLEALLTTFLVGGVRFVVRLTRGGVLGAPLIAGKPTRTVLIYGAGEAGASIVRDMRSRAIHEYSPVGFVDDDRRKVGQTIHGVPVLGTGRELRRVMVDQNPDEVLIAMPTAQAATVRQVVRALQPFKIRITILPNIRDLLEGTVTVSEIRRLAIEDLLPRVPVGIDRAPLTELLSGRRVLVTGAGGSIGSELCQQIAALGPESLVLYERNENSLYTIANVLHDRKFTSHVHPALGDITDPERLNRVLEQFRPEIIFHAAAHKHVPLMEAHPCEAVKNNVGGTRMVAEAAKRHGVARFILISTDKAVNPTSVMGATKRVAELVTMAHASEGDTDFLTVRFGNVLGSNGSAIPRFIEQIKAGGPVTITHPAIRRYFMLLPEAAQLVLHVAGRGRNQGVYVLDMGEQINVEEMARNLIRLSGYTPDEDIAISYVGLRPGEKLFEELVGRRETVARAPIEKVFEVTSGDLPSPEWLDRHVRKLEGLARHGHATGVIRTLSAMLPDYTGRRWETAYPAPDTPALDARSLAPASVATV